MHNDTNLMACLEKGQRQRIASKSRVAAATLPTAIFAFWFSDDEIWWWNPLPQLSRAPAVTPSFLLTHCFSLLPLSLPVSLLPHLPNFIISPLRSICLRFYSLSLIIPLLPKGCRELEHNFLPQKHRLGKALSFRGSSIRTPSTFRALQLCVAVNCLSLLFVHCCAERASWWS